MKVLLDTCTFLWIVRADPHLSATARAVFADPANSIYLSAVSAWEIVVKHQLGRLPLVSPPVSTMSALAPISAPALESIRLKPKITTPKMTTPAMNSRHMLNYFLIRQFAYSFTDTASSYCAFINIW